MMPARAQSGPRTRRGRRFFGPARRARGFTLLEVLMALTVLLIGILLAVFPALIYINYNVSLSSQQAAASDIGEGIMTQLRNLPWSLVVSRGSPPVVTAGFNTCDPEVTAGVPSLGYTHEVKKHKQIYWVSWTVTSPTTDKKDVTISVWWNAAMRCQQRTFQTILDCTHRGDTYYRATGITSAAVACQNWP